MRRLVLFALAWTLAPLSLAAENWPQFRGPGGRASAPDGAKLPTKIGPDTGIVWKTPLPPGHSSPVLHGDRVYLTAIRDRKTLLTIALDRATGRVLWEREAPYKALEKIHKVGSHAQPTPVTDGVHVVSMFGSAGLFGYDREGKPLWHVPMGPFKSEFGAASSPLLVDGRVILNEDHDSDSFLAAYDIRTGKQLWRTDRSEFPVGYASPVVWELGGKKQIVQAGTLRIVGYDFDTGREVWTVRGVSRIVNMTPTIGPDNLLLVPCWAPGADPSDQITISPWDKVVTEYDTNKNGTFEENEILDPAAKQRFAQFDRNKDSHVSRQEWENMRAIFAAAVNRMVAIRPGGTGDITHTHVAWEQTKNLPYVPSPLFYKGSLFLVKNGGFLTSYDPKTGAVQKYDRVGGTGSYHASPVGGDGKVYVISDKGELSVVSAEAQWQLLHRARFNGDVYATPAIADGRIYLRTSEYLYCFGNNE